MTAHAESHPHGDHHGPPLANQSAGVDARLLGMFLFIGSEIMLFGAFFSIYFFVRVVGQFYTEWPPAPYEFPKYVALVNTCILVTSSFTIHWALSAIKRNDRNGLRAGLVLTLLLGTTFLITQFVEYARIGFAPHTGAFASCFFGLTGLHGAHVFVGLTLLLAATVRAFRGHYSEEEHLGVEIPGIYWHFVDVMWIVVYTTVYIL